MKVAILGPYPWDTEKLGGVEVAIVYVQRELLKISDLELHIITCSHQVSEIQQVERDGCQVTYLPRVRLGRVTRFRADIEGMRNVLVRLRPDVVHGHMSGLYAGAALDSGYPAIITVHGIVAQESRLLEGWRSKMRGYLDTQYERSIIRRARHLMSITPYVDQVFEGVFAGRSHLVENACDQRFFELSGDPVPGRLLFAGVVIPRKGILPMIEALALVREKVPHAHLHIAGSLSADPAYVARCQARVCELGLEDAVTFLGHLAQSDVLHEYDECAAFVLPSIQETAPMVIEQAMAAGAPTVATAAGGSPWMLENGRTGYVIPVPSGEDGDPPTLADALLRVLSDPEHARRMGSMAKLEAESRFLPSVVGQRTYEVYQEVAQDPVYRRAFA